MQKRFFAGAALALFVPLMVLANSGAFSISPSRGISSWLLYEIKPGGTETDSVILRNQGSVSQTYTLVALDAQMKAAGDKSESFLLTGRGVPQKGIGKWVNISESKVTLQPGENKSISFTVQVPMDATKETTYAGAIVMAPVAEASSAKTGTSVSIATEVGERMYVRVTDNPGLTATTKPEPVVTKSESKEGKSGRDSDGDSTRNILIGVGALVVLAGAGYGFMKK